MYYLFFSFFLPFTFLLRSWTFLLTLIEVADLNEPTAIVELTSDSGIILIFVFLLFILVIN